MRVQELVDKLRKYSHNYVTTDRYCIQVYSGGKRGNIKRFNETVVCAFDIEDGCILIAPAKDDSPYSFGHMRYQLKMSENVDAIANITHRDAKEIFEAFSEFINNY